MAGCSDFDTLDVSRDQQHKPSRLTASTSIPRERPPALSRSSTDPVKPVPLTRSESFRSAARRQMIAIREGRLLEDNATAEKGRIDLSLVKKPPTSTFLRWEAAGFALEIVAQEVLSSRVILFTEILCSNAC